MKRYIKVKKGFLYECENVENAENPTAINSVYTCQTPIQIGGCTEIDDVFEKFMEYKENGLFEIKPFHSVSDKELDFVYDDMRKIITEYGGFEFSDVIFPQAGGKRRKQKAGIRFPCMPLRQCDAPVSLM